ncbi:MAG TPA: sigma-54 dependent transcriptional regulator [Polyangiaceae bacterium]|nr:sigma-54 dependent transcriptional regulator [Polyangiaceae bacterium]
MTARVLIVDDDDATCRMLELRLRASGYEVQSRRSGHSALECARVMEPHVVLTDLNMQGLSGIDLCHAFGEEWPDVPVVVITAFGSMETAISAIRAGAYDFITKPFDVDALTLAVERAVQHHHLKSEVKRLRAAVGQTDWGKQALIGASGPMMELRSLVARVAANDATVLITGESGTGKEVIARVLHGTGKRRGGPFVPINCAALPEMLLESELFGHVRGAFTDARSNKNGLFVEANGGTLFLDEVGEMPPSLQAKLLRALEERKVRPLGGTAEVTFDARLIAATNRDLDAAVEDGRFREDLYYRLNVLHVPTPPLRSRGADILLLAQHFVQFFALQVQRAVVGLSEAAAERLLRYPWPGNVRELRNCIERAIALTRFDHVSVDDLPERVRDFQSRHVVVTSELLEDLIPLEEVEKRYILSALIAAGGNKSLTAQRLGVSRRTLYRKLEQYGEP